jgi:hypothetical protein
MLFHLAFPQTRILARQWEPASGLIRSGQSTRIAIAGVIGLTSIFQGVVVAIASAAGYRVVLPDAPAWVGVTLLLVGVSTAILGAYWQRVATMSSEMPNTHYVALLQRFRAEFSEARKDFLRDQNFWVTFPSSALDAVFEVAAWRGAASEFTDERLEKSFATVKRHAVELASFAELRTWPHRIAPNMHTALPDNHDEWRPAPETVAAVENLNRAAREFVTAVDEFERIARTRIPLTPAI